MLPMHYLRGKWGQRVPLTTWTSERNCLKGHLSIRSVQVLLRAFHSGLFPVTSANFHFPPTQSLVLTKQLQHRKQVWSEVSTPAEYQGNGVSTRMLDAVAAFVFPNTTHLERLLLKQLQTLKNSSKSYRVGDFRSAFLPCSIIQEAFRKTSHLITWRWSAGASTVLDVLGMGVSDWLMVPRDARTLNLWILPSVEERLIHMIKVRISRWRASPA